MKLFNTFKANYAILGITAYQSLQPYPFNIKILMTFLMFSLSTTSHLVYTFYVANTFTEYTECITTTSGSFIISLCFATMVFKMTTLFEFIAKIEELVTMSRSTFIRFIVNKSNQIKYIFLGSQISQLSKALFCNASKIIEKSNGIISFVSVKIVLQCLMLPKFIVSSIVYFTTDLGSDSLVLPIPMW